MFRPDVLGDAAARRERFKLLFRAQGRMLGYVNVILGQHTATVGDGPERAVSLVVGTSLAKCLKTFEAIRTLCLVGWGEDALVLLRGNVNLLINLGYTLADSEPGERALDFIAYSYTEREKYLREAHGVDRPAGELTMSKEEQDSRGKRWASVPIRVRATRVLAAHYSMGYRFYSSFEHSDVAVLDTYLVDWDEVGPRANAGPSDDHLGVALTHSVIVLADVLRLFCQHFGIDRPEVFAEITALIKSVGEPEGESPTP